MEILDFGANPKHVRMCVCGIQLGLPRSKFIPNTQTLTTILESASTTLSLQIIL